MADDSSRSAKARANSRPDENASKMSSSCEELGKASIRCIEEHGYNRSHPDCQRHYDAYKECRKQQTAGKQQMKSFFF